MNTTSGAPGETQRPVSIGNGDSLIVIDLGRVDLDGASQQFAATVVLHEMIHAYLLTQPNFPSDLTAQHEYMLQNYSATIASALQQLFPGMSSATALSLAVGGYGAIQNNNPTLWSNVLSNLGLTDQQVTSVNNQHKLGTAGTPCQ